MPKQTHQLAAIMFTDIVGYTALMGEDSNRALELVEQSISFQKPLVKNFNGKWIKEMGDGVLARFNSAIDAARCAIEIQKAARESFESKLRIGIHLGDITVKDGDVFGDGVNVASRIESIADPGGIYVSESVEKAVCGQKDIDFYFVGEANLKNVSYKISTYAVRGDGLPQPDYSRLKKIIGASEKKFTIKAGLFIALISLFVLGAIYIIFNQDLKDKDYKIKSLAVLPFDNLTGDNGQEYMVSGMHDQLITALAQISSLNIISKTSTLKYRNTDKSIVEIASELGVDALIEASVLKTTDTVRLNVQLIHAFPVEKHLWSKIFDRSISNILFLYDDITKIIAEEINQVLKINYESFLSNKKQVNPEAFRAYLRGQFEAEKLSPEGFDHAIEHFNEALDIDSNFVQAYSGIAAVWISKIQMRQASVAEAIPKIYEYNQKALELDENYSEAQFIRALMSFQAEWNWSKSEAAIKRAIASNPSHVLSHAFYGHLLLILKRFDEALKESEKAVKMDPGNPMVLSFYGVVLHHSGNLDKALDVGQKSLELNPNNILTLRLLESCYYAKGNYKKSLNYLKQIYRNEIDDFEHIQQLFEEQGYKKAMIALANVLKNKRDVHSLYIAMCLNRGGLHEEALKWILRGYEEHDPDIPYAFLPKEMAVIHERPEIMELAKKLDLPL